MAQPPAGSSLLFGVLTDSGQIKQRKNGSYRMVLDGVDEIDWFTDRPEREAGIWKPQKLLRKWDSMFSLAEPNAQAAFMINGQQKMASFEMSKPKLNEDKDSMRFNLKGIGKNNKDWITGLAGKKLDDVSLFIDNGSNRPACYPKCENANLRYLNLANVDLHDADFTNADFTGSDLTSADLTEVNLTTAYLPLANLTDANLTGMHQKGGMDQRNLNIRNAILTGANLSGADLSYADLFKSDLTRAFLNGADLKRTQLSNTNLTKANLTNINMDNAILYGANLSGANLTDTNLTDADLAEANLTGTIWGNTTCPDGTLNSCNSPCTAKQLIPA